MSNRHSPAARAAVLTAYRIYTGSTYRGTIQAPDRLQARGQAAQLFGLPAGWVIDAYALEESPHDDPLDFRGGLDEHRDRRRRTTWLT